MPQLVSQPDKGYLNDTKNNGKFLVEGWETYFNLKYVCRGVKLGVPRLKNMS